ncbi:hypothetical protein IAT38_002049 [Cryptococcus sp. DSM 104549]
MSTISEQFEAVSQISHDSSDNGISDHNPTGDQSPAPSSPASSYRGGLPTIAPLTTRPMSSASIQQNPLGVDSPTMGNVGVIESSTSPYNATMEDASDSEAEGRSRTGREKKRVDFTEVGSSLFGNPKPNGRPEASGTAKESAATSRNTARSLNPYSDPLPPLPHNAQTGRSTINVPTKRRFDFDPTAANNLPIPVDPSHGGNPFRSDRGSNLSNYNPANQPERLTDHSVNNHGGPPQQFTNRSSARPRVILGGTASTAPYPNTATATGASIPSERRRRPGFIPSYLSLNGEPVPIPHPFHHPHQGNSHVGPDKMPYGFPPPVFSSFSGAPNRPPSFVTHTEGIITSDGVNPLASLLGGGTSRHSLPPPPILFGGPPPTSSWGSNVLSGCPQGPNGVSVIPGGIPGTGRSRPVGGPFAERVLAGLRPASMGAVHSHEPIDVHSHLFDDNTTLTLRNKFTFNKDGSIASYDTTTTVSGPQGFHSDALENASEFHTQMLEKAEEAMNEPSAEDVMRDLEEGFGPGFMRLG